jgi:pimeloyl-ACP methyl ester carboxylesterase
MLMPHITPIRAPHFEGGKSEMLNSKASTAIATAYLKFPKLASQSSAYIPLDTFDRLEKLHHEPITFKNVDGGRLQGYLYPLPNGQKSNRVIVLGHGFTANVGIMAALIPHLHRLGLNVFLFNFNTHGKSALKRTSMGFHEGADTAAALLKMRDIYGEDVKISYLGHSMGAAALLYMPKKMEKHAADLKWIDQHLDKIILDSSYDVLHLSTEPRIQDLIKNRGPKFQTWFMERVKEFEVNSQEKMKLPAPLNTLHPAEEFVKAGLMKDHRILLLHAKDDQRAAYSQAEAIYDKLNKHGYNVNLVQLQGDHYCADWQPDPEHPEKKPLKTVLRQDPEHLKALETFLTPE